MAKLGTAQAPPRTLPKMPPSPWLEEQQERVEPEEQELPVSTVWTGSTASTVLVAGSLPPYPCSGRAAAMAMLAPARMEMILVKEGIFAKMVVWGGFC